MMPKKLLKITSLILFVILFSSCSKEAGKTTAQVRLQLAGITNFSSGIGSGGAIIFGKSANGEQFGKLIEGSQETLEIPNGSWSFYAIMWDATTPLENFYGTTSCGKTARNLTGTAVDISMTLNNSNCVDADFSNNDFYSDVMNKKRFADFFVEECDELNKAKSFHCRAENQGSAVSYRMVFRSFKRMSGLAPLFSNDAKYSTCMNTTDAANVFNHTMHFNFPSSKQAMPFVTSLEMFLGSSDCGKTTTDTKGVFTKVFTEGIGIESSLTSKLVKSEPKICVSLPTSKTQCEDFLGTWNSGLCNGISPTITNFIPTAECTGASTPITAKLLKQMVEIPKDFLCRKSNYFVTGSEVFPGGNGSVRRPYKICNEWQLNQIGEITPTTEDLSEKSYKLMNDLDMNVTDFNPLLRPSCVGMGAKLGHHHNLNPLNKITDGDCFTISGGSYKGVFNGNGKSINNGRIIIENSPGYIGFTRGLAPNAVIKNLTFKNLEVSSDSTITGGVTCGAEGGSLISNVKILGGNIEGSITVGAIAAYTDVSTVVSDVEVRDVSVRGINTVGGLVGNHSGLLKNSMFRGNIKQQMSQDGDVGGLVAISTIGALIESSFSEGVIESSVKRTAGVAATNNGNITNVYSNMYIRSNSYETSSVIGGIIGNNLGGIITKVYSDSILKHEGGASGVVIDGVSAAGGSLSSSTCYSTINASQSGCNKIGNLRQANITALKSDSLWKANLVGTLPRLTWEFEKMQRACLDPLNLLPLTSQLANSGRGHILDPYIICNHMQLKEIQGSTSAQYFKLGEDISINDWTSETNLILSFGGNLEGDDKVIYGMNMSVYGNGNIGLVKSNTGTISNLSIIGNTIVNDNPSGATGILTGVNNGLIKNVEFVGNNLQGKNNVGVVAGANNGGIIDNVNVERGSVQGLTAVGGIAGINSGYSGMISRASSKVYIKNLSGESENFGGIVGHNSIGATIDQTIFSGNIEFMSASLAGVAINVGGIVGLNDGLLKNSMTKNYSLISVKNPDHIGGLVGLNGNAGFIKTSFALGKVIYSDLGNPIAVGATFSGGVGNNLGSIDNKTFYLNNNSGSELFDLSPNSSCLGTEVDFSYLSPSYLFPGTTYVDLMSPQNFNSFNIGINNEMHNYLPVVVNTMFKVVYSGACSPGDHFQFLKSHGANGPDSKSVADFGNISTFAGYDIAYDSLGAGGDIRLDALLEYYKADMDNRASTMAPPIWELEAGESYPRLLQIND